MTEADEIAHRRLRPVASPEIEQRDAGHRSLLNKGHAVTWLIALIIVGFIWSPMEDERILREARRLLLGTGTETIKPSPEPPSPHQLLGNIARPLAPLRHGRRSASAFRAHRPR